MNVVPPAWAFTTLTRAVVLSPAVSRRQSGTTVSLDNRLVPVVAFLADTERVRTAVTGRPQADRVGAAAQAAVPAARLPRVRRRVLSRRARR